MNKINLRTITGLVMLVIGNVCAQTQDTVTSFTYDNIGNVTAVNRPLGRSTSYGYDPLNRMTVQSVAVGSNTLTTTQRYDGLDQLTSVVDPRQLSTLYTKDGLGNKSVQTSPDTAITSYTYDENGNLTSSTDARGKTTHYQYDALSRLITATYQSGTPSVFEYDGGPGGPVGEVGNLTRVTDESGTTTFTHDLFHRVLARTQTVNSGAITDVRTVQYKYGTAGTGNGQLESMTYPSGAQINYHYDSAGQVGSISYHPGDGNGNTNLLAEVPLLTNVTYLATGAVSGWQWGNSVDYTRTYDLDGRLTSYPVDLSGNIRTVGYNAANLITGYTHTSGAVQFNQTFGYDLADRLTSFTLNSVTTTYSYDANDNRTAQTGPSGSAIIANGSNHLQSSTVPIPTSYSYDAAGNRTGDGRLVFNYSDRGRLAHVGGAVNLDMRYNGMGQRVAKLGAVPTVYVYDEAGHTIGSYTAGMQAMETVYLGDLPVSVILPGEAQYVLADQLNAPLALVRTDHSIAWDWRGHDPFGNTFGSSGMRQKAIPRQAQVSAEINTTVSDVPVPMYDHRFPGQIADAETGLFYNYFRDYDPQTGRYIQSDAIGLGGGINTYNYALSNPVKHTDPTGEIVPLVITGVCAAGGCEAIFGLAAAGAMWWSTSHQPIANSGLSDRGLQQAIEKEANRREYKSYCDDPPPPGGNSCDDAQNNLRNAKRCKDARDENTRKWWQGQDTQHDSRMMRDLNNRILNAERDVKRYCPPMCQ